MSEAGNRPEACTIGHLRHITFNGQVDELGRELTITERDVLERPA